MLRRASALTRAADFSYFPPYRFLSGAGVSYDYDDRGSLSEKMK